MTVPRIWVREALPRESVTGHEIRLGADSAHHMVRVLRNRKGDRVILFDGLGGEHQAILTHVSKAELVARVEVFDPTERESSLHVILALGLSRGERMDYSLQKATELGVNEIVPLATTRSVVQLDEKRAKRRQVHWRQIVIGASEQSGRTKIPKMHAPLSLRGWLEGNTLPETRFVLDPSGSGITPLGGQPQSVVFVIGPEGGFESEELSELGHHQFRKIRLGPRVLRTETAAAAAMLFAQLNWGDLHG